MGSSYAKEKSIIDTIAERIEFHGELEAGFKVDSIKYKGDPDRKESSRFDLITAGFTIEAQLTDWITVTAVPLFEIDDFFIDEAHVTIGPTDKVPFYVSAGIHYYPFGRREEYTHFPDDPFVNLPITLYYGELQDPGIILGFSKELMPDHTFTIEGYLYKPWVYACGSYDSIKRTKHADSFGFDVHYNIEKENINFEIGASWTSNILASSGLKAFFEEEDEIYVDPKIDAVAIYMSGEYNGAYFTAEYMLTCDPIKHERLLEPNGSSAIPQLWTFEIGAALDNYFDLPLPIEVMFRYAGSTESIHIYEIPKNRWAVGVNIGIYKYTTWSLAYAYNDYDPDYESVKCEGYADSRHLFFTQLGIEF